MPGTSASHDRAAVNERGAPTAPVGRRTGQGHVMSYGQDRVSAAPGCEVKLSRYNGTAYCAGAHEIGSSRQA
jgi:hypothetical protein